MNVLLAMSPPSLGGRRKPSLARTGLGNALIEGVGNYLIVSHPQLGNSLIVSSLQVVSGSIPTFQSSDRHVGFRSDAVATAGPGCVSRVASISSRPHQDHGGGHECPRRHCPHAGERHPQREDSEHHPDPSHPGGRRALRTMAAPVATRNTAAPAPPRNVFRSFWSTFSVCTLATDR